MLTDIENPQTATSHKKVENVKKA